MREQIRLLIHFMVSRSQSLVGFMVLETDVVMEMDIEESSETVIAGPPISQLDR